MDNTLLFRELVNLLDAFDSVCKKHNLKYTLFAGSLLGAIRNNGFIPWDDDLDVAMLREDYDKLLALPATEFDYPFFLQTPVTDVGYHKSFAKLRNSNTTEIPLKDAIFNYNHGVFIDIFPYDNVPDDDNKLAILIKRMNTTKRLLHWTGRVEGKVGTLGLDLYRKMFYYAVYPFIKMRFITSDKVFKKLNDLSSKYRNERTNRIGTIIFSGDNPRFIYDISDFSEQEYHVFEGKEYPIPKGYDRVLTNSYGNYMVPQKVSSEHGTTVIDVNVSYDKYIAEHKDELFALYQKHRVC